MFLKLFSLIKARYSKHTVKTVVYNVMVLCCGDREKRVIYVRTLLLWKEENEQVVQHFDYFVAGFSPKCSGLAPGSAPMTSFLEMICKKIL